MRIEGRTIYLKRDEVSSMCPADPRWAVRALQMYGLRTDFKSAILNEVVRCPHILKELGYHVVIEDEEDTTEGIAENKG